MIKPPTQLKVVLLGDSGVGKSSLVLRFVSDTFKLDSEATIGASYMGKVIQFNDQTIKFNIWDTAGQERYHSLAKMYYRDANAAILVYDITKPGSLDGLKKWNRELIEYGPKDIAVVIAGNKEDRVDEEVVDPEEVQKFAKSIGSIFKKTSAKTNHGIDQLFQEIAFKIFPELNVVLPTRRGTVTVNRNTNSQNKDAKKKCC